MLVTVIVCAWIPHPSTSPSVVDRLSSAELVGASVVVARCLDSDASAAALQKNVEAAGAGAGGGKGQGRTKKVRGHRGLEGTVVAVSQQCYYIAAVKNMLVGASSSPAAATDSSSNSSSSSSSSSSSGEKAEKKPKPPLVWARRVVVRRVLRDTCVLAVRLPPLKRGPPTGTADDTTGGARVCLLYGARCVPSFAPAEPAK